MKKLYPYRQGRSVTNNPLKQSSKLVEKVLNSWDEFRRNSTPVNEENVVDCLWLPILNEIIK